MGSTWSLTQAFNHHLRVRAGEEWAYLGGVEYVIQRGPIVAR